MKKNVFSVIIISICFLLQSTLLSQFTLGGTVPNLMVAVIASVGFLLGKRSGMWFGFTFGLITDIFFGSLIGIYAILYMMVGYSNGVFDKVLFQRDIKMPLICIAGTDFVYSNAVYLVFFLLNGKFNYLYYFKGIILPELIYTTVFACIIYPFLHFIFRKMDEYDAKHSGEQYIA